MSNVFSEIPPSVATAIAAGKLDPTNMKAFDHTATPTTVDLSQHWQKKATSLSTQKNCFRVFSSSESRTSDNACEFLYSKKDIVQQ